jgi:hypothetical protein
MLLHRPVLIAAALAAMSANSNAACKQELAIYSDKDKALTLEFAPNNGEMMTVSNKFRVVMANDVVLDGIVQWNEDVSRPGGMLMHKCPQGDVTGEELAACTIWEGVVYALDDAGKIDLLPKEGADAAQQILLPDFGRAIRYSTLWDEGKVKAAPWDVLALSGCQE